MSHYIEYLSFDKDVDSNKRKQSDMDSEIYQWIDCNMDHREGEPYMPRIKFDRHEPFKNSTEAMNYLDRVCDSYEFRGVLYYETMTLPESAKMKDIQRIIDETTLALENFIENSMPSLLKSQLLTCKCCGSHINFHHDSMKNCFRCPVCGKDMRSPTAQKRIQAYRNKIDSLEKRYEEERDRNFKKAPLMWLVHCECHC